MPHIQTDATAPEAAAATATISATTQVVAKLAFCGTARNGECQLVTKTSEFGIRISFMQPKIKNVASRDFVLKNQCHHLKFSEGSCGKYRKFDSGTAQNG